MGVVGREGGCGARGVWPKCDPELCGHRGGVRPASRDPLGMPVIDRRQGLCTPCAHLQHPLSPTPAMKPNDHGHEQLSQGSVVSYFRRGLATGETDLPMSHQEHDYRLPGYGTCAGAPVTGPRPTPPSDPLHFTGPCVGRRREASSDPRRRWLAPDRLGQGSRRVQPWPADPVRSGCVVPSMMAMLRSRGRGLRRREIVWYEIKDGVIRPLMRVWRRMSLNIGTLATLSRRGLSREQVSRRTYRTDSKTRLCGRRETAGWRPISGRAMSGGTL